MKVLKGLMDLVMGCCLREARPGLELGWEAGEVLDLIARE